MAKLTLYEVLGVAEDADAEAIAAAYGLKRNGLASLADAEDRRNQLQFLDHAFEVLSDPARRADYDAGLRAQTSLSFRSDVRG